MLAECEPEPGSPGGAEEVGTLDAERVEDRDGVRDPGSQRVGARVLRLVAAALAAVVGEDHPELATQRSGEARRLRDLERIREARVEEDGRACASCVLEERADGIYGVRRVRQALSSVPASTYICAAAHRGARTGGDNDLSA